MKSVLVLEDGSAFEGVSIGALGDKAGMVVLNTAVVGYQEMMTDPANAGKILVLTYPLIGNYGTAKKFSESPACRISALVIKEESRIYSNWQAEKPFGSFLKEEGVTAISWIDTRTLATTIRDKGEMAGIVSTTTADRDGLLKRLKTLKSACSFIKDISVKKATEAGKASRGPNVAVLDLGMLRSFSAQLMRLGCGVTLLPFDTPPADLLKMQFNGLVISGGPENDTAIPEIAANVKALIGKMPIFAISTGHEVLGLALGARLKKMKVGHHGVNYPVRAPGSFKGEITVQNHSYVIDEDSLKGKGVKVTLRNLNDDTIEEMESTALKFLSVQYYPSSPGFGEPNPAFVRFLRMISAKAVRPREVQHAKA